MIDASLWRAYSQCRLSIGHLVKVSNRTVCEACQLAFFVRIRAVKGAQLNLVDLVLTVCVLANPTSCRTEHLYFENRGSLVQCMILAPAEIAKWSGSHPSLKIIRWTCVFPSKNREKYDAVANILLGGAS